jgi:hypothetical protein
LYLLTRAALNGECSSLDVDCGGLDTSIAILGAGLAVWIAGKQNAKKPHIVWTPRGVAIGGRVSF